jgi:hypothetical protein
VRKSASNMPGIYINLNDAPHSADKNEVYKSKLSNSDFHSVNQKEFKNIPGAPIAYWVSSRVRDIFLTCESFGEVATAKQGLATGNNSRFTRYWFEVNFAKISFDCTSLENSKRLRDGWVPYSKGGGNFASGLGAMNTSFFGRMAENRYVNTQTKTAKNCLVFAPQNSTSCLQQRGD